MSRSVLDEWADRELATDQQDGRSWRGSEGWGRPYPDIVELLQHEQDDPDYWPAAHRDGVARPEQLAPGTPGAASETDDWYFWLLLAGRGFGKTRTIVEFANEKVRTGAWRNFGIIAPTSIDVRDTLINGPGGFLKTAGAGEVPQHESSNLQLVWPNGAVGHLRSAETPDRLRGPGWDGAICDELCAWRFATAAWSNLMFTLREGPKPQVAIATTPKPMKILKDVLELPKVVVHRDSSYKNIRNLAPTYVEMVIRPYEGTRLGRQEIHAEILDDVPGALWTMALIEAARKRTCPPFVKAAVAIDPAVSAGEDSAETGILIGGRAADGDVYVVADLSGRVGPEIWAERALDGHDEWQADELVGEVNNGGDLVERNIKATAISTGRNPARYAYRAVRASRGKRRRAEPVAALFGSVEKGKERPTRVWLVGVFPELEDQMIHALAEASDWPNDRVDALVWLIWRLSLDQKPVPKVAPSALSEHLASPWGGVARRPWGS